MASTVCFSTMQMLLLLLLSLFRLRASYSSPSMQPLCHDDESYALLQFKESLVINESASSDPSAYPKVASWRVDGESADCCSWDGVECDRDTAHVIGLDLSSSCLYGSIESNSSLFHLKAESCRQHSKIPSEIRNLTKLNYLDLSFNTCYSSPSMQPLCHDDESDALLQLKESLVINESASSDPSAYPKVASWKVDGESGDCCSWDGVKCDGDSGHVIGLDLSSSCLYGSIDSNSSLFHLVQLRRLNLADNDFNNSEIPSEIRNLSRLFDLDLSMSRFSGQIPAEILDLSKLVSLDLGGNTLKLQKPGLQDLVEALTILKVLHLSEVEISSKVPQIMANLSSLSSLFLRECGLQGEFPMGIFQLPNLRFLSIRYNPYLTGYLPEFQSGNQLESLLLAGTSFSGNHTQLISLYLGDNKLHGPIPESIYRLQNLEDLDLASNFFSGTLDLNLLLNFRNLVSLQLSYTNLSLLNSNNSTIPQPKLELLTLSGYNLGEFPSFLRHQNHLELLDLADDKLEGHIPKWFMNMSTITLEALCLTGNLLTGFEQSFDVLPWKNLRSLQLYSNKLQGSLPIPPPAIFEYKVWSNKLTGEIPKVICDLTSLSVLELSNNNLSGKLPPCLGNKSRTASVLNLRNNSFSGDIPETFTSGCSLRVVDFSQNKLEGKIPKSLANCTKLDILNLEQNNINDVFPSWLGALPHLRVLILRSNGLHGVIGKPKTNVEFPSLQIVDLSNNSFKGKLPLEYFRNWTAMKTVHKEHLIYMQVNTSFKISDYSMRIQYQFSMTMTNKGVMILYEKIQDSLTTIDFSSPIPRGHQFGTFDNTSFDANPGLCGEPLSKECGNGEDSLPAAKEDGGSGYPLEFGWKVVVIGYATGLVIGVILGCAMNTRKYEWLVKNYFARWQYKGQNLKTRLRRN
ncbi:hypothetical protein NC651_035875 [Populus alba x Populus x berolinensis]|nr:hypothetical protein NC651_035875 [Populus alba x Populus x berolinensis]